VLVYASNSAAPQHDDCRQVVERSVDGRIEAALVPQVLLEFHAVITDRRRLERPLTPGDAWAQIDALRSRIPVLEVPRSVMAEMDGLIATHVPVGGDVFDVFLVAQMRAHGIRDICTEDVDGFERFAADGVSAMRPSAVQSR
jgi:predicted nucleic acid-binding protein